jgi:hypothetical protein
VEEEPAARPFSPGLLAQNWPGWMAAAMPAKARSVNYLGINWIFCLQASVAVVRHELQHKLPYAAHGPSGLILPQLRCPISDASSRIRSLARLSRMTQNQLTLTATAISIQRPLARAVLSS